MVWTAEMVSKVEIVETVEMLWKEKMVGRWR
jgi:hypothetical protein